MNGNSNLLLRWWSEHGNLRTLYLLFLGQVVSFFLALMSFTSSLIATLGVDAPLSQSFSTYLSLGLVYGSVLIYRRQRILVSWYWYLLLGFADVQGSYFINKAYQFSSITSVTLLDCCTLAWVIVLTWIFLGTRYSLWQLFGAVTCVVGVGLVLLSDAGVGGGGLAFTFPAHISSKLFFFEMSMTEIALLSLGGSKPLLGDSLVLVATVFFAMLNVGEEFLLKKRDRVEVVCMIGVCGFLVTLCEIPFIEPKSLESVTWTTDIVLAFCGYALAGFMFYSVAPFVLKMGGATMFNLSILTADMWAVVFRIFFYRQQVDWLYYVSFGVVVIGLVIYSLSKKYSTPTSECGIDVDTQYETLPSENNT